MILNIVKTNFFSNDNSFFFVYDLGLMIHKKRFFEEAGCQAKLERGFEYHANDITNPGIALFDHVQLLSNASFNYKPAGIGNHGDNLIKKEKTFFVVPSIPIQCVAHPNP